MRGKVAAYITDKASPYADEIIEDAIGNLLIFKKGVSRPDNKIMLASHMDEVGVIVTAVGDDGYLKFDFVGGVDRRVVLGKRVLIGEKRVPGVIGLKAVHLSPQEERDSIPKLKDLNIDIGAAGRKEAESLVSPGDTGIFDSSFIIFGNGMIKARALDDRIGCSVLLRLLQSELPVDTWFAFTVQEEVGCRGAATAAYRIRPDISVVVEGTTAADLPSQKGADKVCIPGRGPVIPFMDNGAVYDRELFKQLGQIARNNGISWQTKTMISGGTDAQSIQKSGSSVRVAAVSAAVRYIHSPSGVACIEE
jgi:endoglucanase